MENFQADPGDVCISSYPKTGTVVADSRDNRKSYNWIDCLLAYVTQVICRGGLVRGPLLRNCVACLLRYNATASADS